MDPPLSTPTRQTSGRGNNHIAPNDTTKEVPLISSKLPFDGIMEESVNKMTTMLSNILEHHGRANQRLASLEEDLIHARREEEKLKATIEALEKERNDMNTRVALMERKDLYKFLQAKMEGFQIATIQERLEVSRTSTSPSHENGWRSPRSTWRSLRNVPRTIRSMCHL
ncbi:hypothetical protein R1flu_008706 [Riccia fluitans]|uniref:Uncharacterized protein n=1 Tax=Riccia fluitans TaxID=41844 RepID=A0ABD1YCH1_9MARC